MTKTVSRAPGRVSGWEKSRNSFLRLVTGGDWAFAQPAALRRNLVWFWFDGFFASGADNIVGTYLVVYLLALGATQAQIGMMSSLSSLSAALLLLPGAMLVERIGRRRNLVLIGGGWARLGLLFVALLPLLLKAPILIPVTIIVTVSRDAMANLSYPAWMSLTGDVVPIEGRGRYFASRNFIRGISGMVMIFVAGLVITHIVQPAGYQVVLIAAFVLGSLSVFSFAHITDKHRPPAFPRVRQPVGMALSALVRDLTANRDFLSFAATTALWNFSLNIAGPFFSVYLVKDLHASATMVGITTIASSVATILSQRRLGHLNDKWGARRLTMISGLLIPIVPFLWVFAGAAWHVILINLLSGTLWSAYNLGSFNYLLMIIPEDRRARYSALFQITVTISLAIGAALGSLVVTRWGYHAVFIGSSAGRLIAALLFVRLLTMRRVMIKPSAASPAATQPKS